MPRGAERGPERGEALDVECVERALERGERAQDGRIEQEREERVRERVAELGGRVCGCGGGGGGGG